MLSTEIPQMPSSSVATTVAWAIAVAGAGDGNGPAWNDVPAGGKPCELKIALRRVRQAPGAGLPSAVTAGTENACVLPEMNAEYIGENTMETVGLSQELGCVLTPPASIGMGVTDISAGVVPSVVVPPPSGVLVAPSTPTMVLSPLGEPAVSFESPNRRR